MENRICPYCGSENWEWMGDEYSPQVNHCHECDRWFGDDDIVREDLRHKISAILMDTDEDSQIKCEIALEPEDSCGISTLEMPVVDSCYQEPCEGRIWFHINGCADVATEEKQYLNFDDIPTKDLMAILEKLRS